MIFFYRTKRCRSCGFIEEALKELVVAHKVMTLSGKADYDKLPKATKPPVLIDGETTVEGSDEITAYLEKIKGFKELWDKYQSDACYCDEEEDG